MDELIVELNIFSPRWGHNDIYKFQLTRESLMITLHAQSTKCTWRDNRDPEWTGNTLTSILRNDSIYPPEILQDLIEHAWISWRKGELDNTAVKNELQALATWLNTITETKPATAFWKSYF